MRVLIALRARVAIIALGIPAHAGTRARTHARTSMRSPRKSYVPKEIFRASQLPVSVVRPPYSLWAARSSRPAPEQPSQAPASTLELGFPGAS